MYCSVSRYGTKAYEAAKEPSSTLALPGSLLPEIITADYCPADNPEGSAGIQVPEEQALAGRCRAVLGTEEQGFADTVQLAVAQGQELLVAQELVLLNSEGRERLDAVVRQLPVVGAASAQ